MRYFLAKLQQNGKYLVFMIAIAFIIYGMTRQEYLVVLKKAVNICLECIGIG